MYDYSQYSMIYAKKQNLFKEALSQLIILLDKCNELDIIEIKAVD